jgi:hypothetical protein
MKNLIIVGGTMGVGKSATCHELQKLMPRNVFLDGDWCWSAEPFVVNDETKAMVMSNITYLLGSFIRCSEYENIIFCWVLHERSILDDLLGRIDTQDCMVHWYSLICSEKALAERLRCDVEAGQREPDIIERSTARLPLYQSIGSVNIDVTDITAAEAAARIAAGI